MGVASSRVEPAVAGHPGAAVVMCRTDAGEALELFGGAERHKIDGVLVVAVVRTAPRGCPELRPTPFIRLVERPDPEHVPHLGPVEMAVIGGHDMEHSGLLEIGGDVPVQPARKDMVQND